jgi:hypothetical protein
MFLKVNDFRLIKETHTSKIVGHFGVGKTISNLQSYVYWLRMQEYVAQYIRGCILCHTNKPSNRKQGLSYPLLVPTRPWESISMDFVGGLPTIRKGHDYLFVIIVRFIKMCILMPCKKNIDEQEATKRFFEHVQVHFGIPRSIISNMDTRFLSAFWTTLWVKMDTRLNRSTTFHPQIDGHKKVVNKTLAQLLRGYNQKHQKTWDENIIYTQHSYNISFHTYTSKSPFETFFGYLPPSPLDVVYGQQ